MGTMLVSVGGTNGANGLADVDDDVAIESRGLIAPLLPLPCGASSMVDASVGSGSIDVVVLVDNVCVAMLRLSGCVFG